MIHGRQIIIFFTVVLIIYILSNLYIFFKGYNALSEIVHKRIYVVTFILLASTFILGRIIEVRFSGPFSDILNIIGGFWLAFMLYGTLLWFLADIFTLVQKPFSIIPHDALPRFRFIQFISITTITSLLILVGFINAVSPVVRHYDITLDKDFKGEKFRIAAVSDIHLGSIIRKRSMRHLSRMLENEKPEIVLLLGDVIDGSIGPVIRGDLLNHLRLPELPFGIYAITGNHEFIGNPEKTIPYIESKGIRVLKDELITLDNGVQIVGRYDRSYVAGINNGRKSLQELLASADTTLPLIVLDHQPGGLSELHKYGIDLQMSGHTHDGQMWPLNLITRSMFELSHGYKIFGSTHVIVSSGFGIWGPRVRLGTRPEIVIIDLKNRL